MYGDADDRAAGFACINYLPVLNAHAKISSRYQGSIALFTKRASLILRQPDPVFHTQLTRKKNIPGFKTASRLCFSCKLQQKTYPFLHNLSCRNPSL